MAAERPAASGRESTFTFLPGDALAVLRDMESRSIDCCVTSPPYYRQRDYGVDRQIGQEGHVLDYVHRLGDVFNEVHRVLRDEGSLWLNLGDKMIDGELLGVPWLVAFELKARGWTLRMDNVWSKVGGITEPLRKRSTPSHEYIFHFTKTSGRNYFHDAEAVSEPSAILGRPQRRRAEELFAQHMLTDDHLAAIRAVGMNDAGKAQVTQNSYGRNAADTQRLADEAKAALGGYFREFLTRATKNRRSVWTIAQEPSASSHVAPFPAELARLCISAGCPAGGVVLDPFIGSGTTARVAASLGRRCVGIDLVVCDAVAA